MPVLVPLNESQIEVLNQAVKGKGIDVGHNQRVLTVTRDNCIPLCQALTELHAKKFKVRTKTEVHVSICYHAQNILAKLRNAAAEFGFNDTMMTPKEDNDNSTVVLVSSEEAANIEEADNLTDNEDDSANNE